MENQKSARCLQARWKLLLVILLASLAMQSSVGSSFAAPAQPAGPSARLPAAHPAPNIPECVAPPAPPTPPGCSLQVILLIDDSTSMRSSDPYNTRWVGAKNVLDILAKEYYLPAVDANLKELPNIQVALIHFSDTVLKNSGWRPVNPKSLADWDTQLKQFEPDLSADYDLKHENTDFKVAFKAAGDLAGAKDPNQKCPRLVMLFTDGMPNMGRGSLTGSPLAKYMQELDAVIQADFSPRKDGLYVTAFASGGNWVKTYSDAWKKSTGDSAALDPQRADYVKTPDLVALRMEQIVATTIGDQSYTLNPDAGTLTHYTTVVPAMLESLRLTYYKQNLSANFTVTDPQGKLIEANGDTVILTGENTPVQVLEIKRPAPGTYKIKTTSWIGRFTRLINFQTLTAKPASPGGALLQFNDGQFAFELLDSSGAPVAPSPNLSVFAALTQAGQTSKIKLFQSGSTYRADWLPLTTEKAQLDACAMLNDPSGVTSVLFYDTVKEITVDAAGVQAGEGKGTCVPSDASVTIPLQVINATTGQPAKIDYPIQWRAASLTSPGGKPVNSTISEVDANTGAYALTFKPSVAEDVQSSVSASALVIGQSYKFYQENLTTTGFTARRSLALTLTTQTLADRLSIWFYHLFHGDASGDGQVIQIGRRLFGWLGPSSVQVSGRFIDTDKNQPVLGIERFSTTLVSQGGGKSSQSSSAWQTADDGTSTIRFPAPGLGRYQVAITDNDPGKSGACFALADLPGQNLLLINDFWEYLFWLLLVLLFILLLAWLILRLIFGRNRLWGSISIVEKEKEVWSGLLSRHSKQDGKSAYDWKFTPHIFGIRAILIRSWTQRRGWLLLTVISINGKQTFKRSLDHWEDCILDNGCKIVYHEEVYAPALQLIETGPTKA